MMDIVQPVHISIACPTYNRPAQCKRMVESARATADSPDRLQVLLGISGEGSVDDWYGYNITGVTAIDARKYPTAHVLNMLEPHAVGELLMIVGDDAVFATPGWDTALYSAYNALHDKRHVFSLRDSRDPDGTPHPIVTRAWVEALGYLAPPLFLHWCVDTWLVGIAKATGRFTHLRDYLLVHDKPSDNGVVDITHSRIRAMGWHDRDMAVYNQCQRYMQADIGVMNE